MIAGLSNLKINIKHVEKQRKTSRDLNTLNFYLVSQFLFIIMTILTSYEFTVCVFLQILLPIYIHHHIQVIISKYLYLFIFFFFCRLFLQP